MRTIHKYPLEIADVQRIMMPKDAMIIAAQVQYRDQICLWAIVDPELPPEPRTILIRGTGHPIADETDNEWFAYIGTVQMHDGQFVWHVGELVEMPVCG